MNIAEERAVEKEEKETKGVYVFGLNKGEF